MDNECITAGGGEERGHAQDLVGMDLAIARRLGIYPFGVAEHGVVAEAHGTVGGFVLREKEVVLELVGNFVQLGLRRRVGDEVLNLGMDGILGVGWVLAVAEFATDDEETLGKFACDVGVDFGEDGLLLDETLVEARGLSVGEDVADGVVDVEIVVEAVAHDPSHVYGSGWYRAADGVGMRG